MCASNAELSLLERHTAIRESFSVSLRSVGCGVFLLLTACASAKPAEIYLEKGRVAGLNRMLLSVSATEASVEHAQAKPLATKQLFPLVGLLPVLIEQGVRQSEDQKTAEVTARTVPKAWCEQIMRDVFQDELTGKRGILLQDVQAPPTPTEHQQFLSEGYSAFLSLALVDLSLRWTTGDVAAMHAEVHGQLTEFASGRLAWNRYESAMSAQSYPIDRYLANQGELLRSVAEGLLRKVMVRLTYDFVYAQ